VGGSGAVAPGGEELSKMSTRLTDQELFHLLEFIGYGTLDADVWFLGMEEAGGGEDNLRKRLKFKRVEDCAEGHKILGIEKHRWGSSENQKRLLRKLMEAAAFSS